MIRCFKTSFILAAALLLCGTFHTSTSFAEEIETPPIFLQSASLVSADLMMGPNYMIKATAVNDGLIVTYDLDTSYGPLRVESTALLMKRVSELRALVQIEQIKGSDAYMQAARQMAAAPLKTAAGLVQDPAGTLSGVESGIGRFFTRVSTAITSDGSGGGISLNSALGQAAYKRQYAYQFGVDPYTSYEPLQKALNDLAWKAAAGALTVKAAFMAIPGGAGIAVSMSGTADNLSSMVRDKTPAELASANQDSLAAMGVPGPVAQQFLQNTVFDPQEQTLLVGALAAMARVGSPGIYIQTAAAADEEPLAVFLRTRAQLLQAYAAKTGTVQSFVDAGGIPVLQTAGGKIVALFPLDYVAWTPAFVQKEKAVSAAIKKIPGVAGKEFLITGTLSPTARKAMESRGWKVEERIGTRLLGS